MNWHDVLPEQIAINQIAFERREMVLRAYQAGAKQKEIAAKLGISPSIVSDMVRKALKHKAKGTKPPVTSWCEQCLPEMIRPMEYAAWRKNRREFSPSYKPPPRYTFEPWP